MKKKISLLVILLAMTLLTPFAFAEGTTVSVSAYVDNTTGLVTISGSISSGSDKIVTIKVINPAGSIDFLDQVTSGAGGNYLSSYTLDEATSGTYRVSAGGEDIDTPNTTSFDYTDSELPPVSAAPFLVTSNPKAVDKGQEVTVTVMTSNVIDLYAYDFTFQYDTGIFEFISGQLAAGTGNFRLLSHINGDDNDGKIRVLATQTGDIPGISGDKLPLVTFVLKAKASKGTGEFSVLAGAEACSSIEELSVTSEISKAPVSIINCDVNEDGKFDIVDIVKIAKAFGRKLGEPGYVPELDINKDDVIDIYDMTYIALKVLGNLS